MKEWGPALLPAGLLFPHAGFFVLSSTLGMAGEQWISEFVWHWNIMVTHYQPRDMSFVLTWHKLITLIWQCLLKACSLKAKEEIITLKYVKKYNWKMPRYCDFWWTKGLWTLTFLVSKWNHLQSQSWSNIERLSCLWLGGIYPREYLGVDNNTWWPTTKCK